MEQKEEEEEREVKKNANDNSILVVKRLHLQRVRATTSFPFRRSLDATPSAKALARGWSECVPSVIKSGRSVLERCKTRTHAQREEASPGEKAVIDDASKRASSEKEKREKRGERLLPCSRWVSQKWEEASARDTRTRHTINTIFALPRFTRAHPNSIHPSIQWCR